MKAKEGLGEVPLKAGNCREKSIFIELTAKVL
jgi:hypothetical protein